MSGTLERIKELVRAGNVRPSGHARIRFLQRDLQISGIVEGVESAILVEDYPLDPKGPSALVLQRYRDGSPVHVVWGILDRMTAVVITAYRPDGELWNGDFLTRKS